MSNQTIRRATHDKDNPYRSMRRATFEDRNLSFEARGLLGYILVKPDDWEVNIANLMKEGGIGRDKVYRLLDELMEFRYCKRVERRHKGQFSGYIYEIYEDPYVIEGVPHTENTDAATPFPEKPYTEKPHPVFQEHTNKEEVPTKKEEEKLAAQQPPPVSELDETEQKALAKQLKAAYKEVYGIAVDEGRLATGAKKLSQVNCTPEELKGCYAWMKEKTWWFDKVVSIQTIYSNLEEYRRSLTTPAPTQTRTTFKNMKEFNEWADIHDPQRRCLYEGVTINGLFKQNPKPLRMAGESWIAVNTRSGPTAVTNANMASKMAARVQ